MDLAVGFALGFSAALVIAVLASWRFVRRYQKLAFEKQTLELQKQAEKEAFEEKTRFYEQTESRVEHVFRSLSASALAENQKSFLELARSAFSQFESQSKLRMDHKEEAVQRLVDPIAKALEQMKQQVDSVEKQRISSFQSINEQVGQLMSLNQNLLGETAKLASALRSPTARGAWGEIQLKRVVEAAGMLEHCDFQSQATINTSSSGGRPDLLIKLPGNRVVAVDAKAPMQAYLEALEESDDKKQKDLMRQHATQVKKQIQNLSKKSYWEGFSQSPEFVLLFLPGESYFSEALRVEPSLIEEGVKLNIILCTPTTLIALLKTVAYAWRQEALAENTRVIAKLGAELHKRILDFSGHLGDVGRYLNNSVKSYNSALGTLERRVMVTARKLKSFGVEAAGQDLDPIDPIKTEVHTPP